MPRDPRPYNKKPRRFAAGLRESAGCYWMISGATRPARRSRNDGAGGGARARTSSISLFPRRRRSQAGHRGLAVRAALVARAPIPCVLPCVRVVPEGLRVGSKPPDHARALGHPVPHSGHMDQEADGSPKCPRYPYRGLPRSETPVVSCALAMPRPGLRPSGHWKPSAFLSLQP